jgi:hypothetical protein
MAIGRITGQMLSANLARSGTDLTFETNLLALDVTNSRVGVGTASPATTLHISATDAIRLPSGSTAQRPGSPANGDIRYNSDTGAVEGYASGWLKMTGGTSLADADADTQIEVERSADEDQIHFQVAGTDAAHIRADGQIELNNLNINDQTITGLSTNGNIVITPNGTGRTTITNLTVAGSFDMGDLNALNVGDINVDSVSSDNGTDFDLLMDDNQANALEIKEGSNTYINFATTDSSELITVSKNMTIASGVTFTTDTADINGGAIDGTTIGAASAAAGTFTTATATNVQATNLKANDGTAAITIADSTGDVGVTTNLEVTGNLTVNGTTTTIDSQTLTVEDPLIQLAKNNSGGSANTFDQGLFFNRGSDDNVSFIWDESADQFAVAVTSGEDGTTAGNVTIDSYAAFKAGVITASDVETATVSAADGTLAMTMADSTGVVTFNAAPSFGDNNITNVGDIALDTISADGTTIGVSMTDNTAAAFDIKEGSNSYLKFDTTNSSELITASQAFTVASGVTFTTDTADINGGAIDGTTIGANSAAAATFTTATATSVNATNVRANDGTAAIVITDSTGAVAVSTALTATGNVSIDGGTFTFNDAGADLDFRFEGDTDQNLLFGDAGNDRIGIGTNTPNYILDIGSSTDALKLPEGNTATRPTAATGIIRFNTETGKYEGSTDGSTYVDFATAGDTPTFTKETTTGDGSTTTFSGFFSTAPASANNVFVYIDNVYQEPTENYTVSGTNITFTSAPHSGARIFAITGADNSALVTGGVARSETTSVSVSGSSATNIMTFNAATYRSAELFIVVQDSGNTQYSAMKATVIHDGTTAYGSTYAVTNTAAGDIVDITFNHDGSNTVEIKATPLNSGTQSIKVQYSLLA